MTEWLIKAMQASENGNGPEFGSGGWNLIENNATRLVNYPNWFWNSYLSAADTARVLEAYLTNWLAKVNSYKPAQFYAGGSPAISPTDVIDPNGVTAADQTAYMIPQFHYLGVSTAITDQIIAWAKTIWPSYNWDATRAAVCTPGTSRPNCTW
jgi:hypothetical protein